MSNWATWEQVLEKKAFFKTLLAAHRAHFQYQGISVRKSIFYSEYFEIQRGIFESEPYFFTSRRLSWVSKKQLKRLKIPHFLQTAEKLSESKILPKNRLGGF